MNERANIFKTAKPKELAPDSPDARVVKTNIFKSAHVRKEEDGVPETPIDRPQKNIFKNIPSDRVSPNTASERIINEPSPSDRKQTVSSAFPRPVFIGGGILIGLAFGAYVFLSSEDTPKTPITPPLSPAEQQTFAPQSPSVAPNPASDITQTSISTFKPYLAAMLHAAHNHNRNAVDQAVSALSDVPRPPLGNRASARSYNDQGLVALKSQNYADAIDAFRLGVAQDPGNVELINNLGFALYKSGLTYPAKEQIELSLLLSPKRSSAWVNLGDVFFKEGNESNAIDAYMLAYAFATNKDRLYKTVESLAENDPDSFTRIFYSKVLATIRHASL